MAQRVTVLLTDDITGDAADETVTFALDGMTYDIDLNTQNAARLREALAPFTAAGRRKGRTNNSTPTTPPRAGTKAGRDAAQIREWASDHGLYIAARGRVPADVIAAYDNRNSPILGPQMLATALRRFPLKDDVATVAPQPPAASQLPDITDADRAHAERDPKAASAAAVERLTYARDHEGFFPTQGGSMSSSAVVALIRKGFGEDTEKGRRVNGAGLALLELAETKAAAKARGK